MILTSNAATEPTSSLSCMQSERVVVEAVWLSVIIASVYSRRPGCRGPPYHETHRVCRITSRSAIAITEQQNNSSVNHQYPEPEPEPDPALDSRLNSTRLDAGLKVEVAAEFFLPLLQPQLLLPLSNPPNFLFPTPPSLFPPFVAGIDLSSFGVHFSLDWTCYLSLLRRVRSRLSLCVAGGFNWCLRLLATKF